MIIKPSTVGGLMNTFLKILVILVFSTPSFAQDREIAVPALPSDYLKVPLIYQATDYSCGAAALMSVLYYWGAFDGKETDLYKDLDTTTEGTHPQKMAQLARAIGLQARVRLYTTLHELEVALANGETVILDIQAWPDTDGPEAGLPWPLVWESGHYVVLVGMDDHYAYFMDPSLMNAHGYIPLMELIERWHDYETSADPVNKFKRWNNVNLAIFINGISAPQTFETLSRIE
jgi:predicted double-glycine peptidase